MKIVYETPKKQQYSLELTKVDFKNQERMKNKISDLVKRNTKQGETAFGQFILPQQLQGDNQQNFDIVKQVIIDLGYTIKESNTVNPVKKTNRSHQHLPEKTPLSTAPVLRPESVSTAQNSLEGLSSQSKEVQPDTSNHLKQSLEELRNGGIAAKVPKSGKYMCRFELKFATREPVSAVTSNVLYVYYNGKTSQYECSAIIDKTTLRVLLNHKSIIVDDSDCDSDSETGLNQNYLSEEEVNSLNSSFLSKTELNDALKQRIFSIASSQIKGVEIIEQTKTISLKEQAQQLGNQLKFRTAAKQVNQELSPQDSATPQKESKPNKLQSTLLNDFEAKFKAVQPQQDASNTSSQDSATLQKESKRNKLQSTRLNDFEVKFKAVQPQQDALNLSSQDSANPPKEPKQSRLSDTQIKSFGSIFKPRKHDGSDIFPPLTKQEQAAGEKVLMAVRRKPGFFHVVREVMRLKEHLASVITEPPYPSEVFVKLNVPEAEALSEQTLRKLLFILAQEEDVSPSHIKLQTSTNEINEITERFNKALEETRFSYEKKSPVDSYVTKEEEGENLTALNENELFVEIAIPVGRTISQATFKSLISLLVNESNIELNNIRVITNDLEVKSCFNLVKANFLSSLKPPAPTNFAFMLDIMANAACTAVIAAGIATALIAFGVLSGGAGYAPFIATVAALLSTSVPVANTVLGSAGLVVAAASVGLSLFSVKKQAPASGVSAEPAPAPAASLA